MSKYFDTDNRKLGFEVHENNVSVVSISKAEGGINREILIPRYVFLELIAFVEIRCRECLDIYPFYEAFTFGTSIKVSSFLEFCNTNYQAERKIHITFKEPCSDDKEALGFKFNLKRLLEFKKFLLQFKSLQVKSHKIHCEESVKMKESSYKYKPLNVKAEPYKIGMEDGVDISMRSRLDGHIERFIVRDTLKENGATVQDNVERLYANNKAFDVEEYKPFIDYCDNKHYIDKTDMIVTDALGDRFPMSLKVFKATFEEVK